FTGLKNLEIFYQHWRPESEPRAVLVIVHGLAEHSGRYQHVAEYFVGRGYAVYALDHHGHGRSGGERVHVDRFDDFVVDLRTLVDLVQRQETGRGVFLIGHSMGGVIATLFAAQHGDTLQGLILSGSSVRVSGGVSPVLVKISQLLSVLAPKLGVTPLDAASVSRDPDVVTRYDSDPLNYRGRVRARMGAELLQAGNTVLANLHKITVPILIMHAGADQLADPEGSRQIYEGVSSTDKTLKIYDGLYHEIFNEPEKAQVLADVAGWLEKRMR
ncbi:MAG: alpha/beta hydrolase, partial [Anaerolineae bacterium]